MHTKTAARSAGALAVLLAVGLTAAGCTPRTRGNSQLRLPSDPPSALVVVGPRALATLAPVTAAVSRSARTGEHLEIANPADAAAPVLASTVAPAPPSMPGPSQPPRLSPGATKFLVDQHNTEVQKYNERLSADRSALRHELSTQLRSWAGSAELTVARAPSRGREAGVRASVSQADGFFDSLDQAGVSLGTRKVLVLLGTPAMAGTVTPLAPSSVAGMTVILADFTGGQTAEAEWQADFLQAGAARSVVLSPGAQDELAPVITEGLSGERGPAPAHVDFALNRAALSPAARARLGRLAAWLSSACPRAPVTILGFADPLGSRVRNGELARQRALTTMAYLARRGISPARMSAAGYGTGLPAAPSNSHGAQPLDRRAVIVTNPAAGQRGC
jgi:outer membrane protein OmpA-like peptidoglycan-associated protein